MRLTMAATLASVLLLFSTACHTMAKATAERCVLVDLQQEQGRQLLPLLDAFAKSHDLASEMSHPISPKYQRASEGRPTAEVMYRMGMGRFGAVLTLFRYDSTLNEDLLLAFDGFVESQIATRYKVTQCADVPGFQVPVAYR